MPAVEYLDVPNKEGYWWVWTLGKDHKTWVGPFSPTFVNLFDIKAGLFNDSHYKYVRIQEPPAPPMEDTNGN